MSTIPRIAMTIGDPSGVGPEIAVKILSKPENRDKALVSLLASPEEVESLAAEIKVSVPLTDLRRSRSQARRRIDRRRNQGDARP